METTGRKRTKRVPKFNILQYRLHTLAKHRAKRDGTPFTIEPIDIVSDGVCPVFKMPFKISKGKQGAGEWSPTLDRIIPELGYVPGNIIVVSHKANVIKNAFTPDEIITVGNFYKTLMEKQNV